MSESRMSEIKLREQWEPEGEATEAADGKQSNGHLAWKIVGGAALAIAATALIASLNDIRRYIRISRM